MKSMSLSVGMLAALSRVMHQTTAAHFRCLVLLTPMAAMAFTGCGDAGMFSRGELRQISEADLGVQISESDFVIEHRSTRCDEYAVAACPRGEAPSVEVHVVSRSIVFDFSNVEEPGEFADAHFDGFVFEATTGTEKPILYVAVDSEQSNLDIDPRAITYGRDYLEVNFAGVAFDSDGFLKVDLLVGPLNPLRPGR